jgi:hypothetical protein
VVVVGTLGGSSLLAWLALAVAGGLRSGLFWRAEPVWTHLATYASAILVAIVLLVTLGRDLRVRQHRASFWLLLLSCGAIIGIIAPGGIIFFVFPPLLALAGMVVARWWRPAEAIASVAAILFLYVTWGGMLALLEELLNSGPLWVFAPLGSLIILPVLIEAKPVIEKAGIRGSSALAAALALAAWAGALAAPAYSADRQQRFVIQHVTDAARGKSWWSVLNDGAKLPAAFPGEWKRGTLPFSERQRWLAAAPADPFLRPPGVQRVSEARSGTERMLSIRLTANGAERIELIAPADAQIRAAGRPGFVRPIDLRADGKTLIACSGRSCVGAVIEIRIGQLAPVEFTLIGSRAPLPLSAAPLLAARPRFARPQYNRDEAIIFARQKL